MFIGVGFGLFGLFGVFGVVFGDCPFDGFGLGLGCAPPCVGGGVGWPGGCDGDGEVLGVVPLLTITETSGSLYIEYPSHLGKAWVRKYIEEDMSKPVEDLPASDW